MADRVSMACKAGFRWCYVSLLQTVQKEYFKPQSSHISDSSTVDHQINENAVAGGGRLNFSVVNNVNSLYLSQLKLRE